MAQGTILGQSGAGSSLNVFAQLTEPSKKDGIWIKTEKTVLEDGTTLPAIEKYKYNYIKFLYKQYVELKNLGLTTQSATSINDAIYSCGNNANVKYDIKTNSYTNLNNIPFDFQYGAIVAVGTDIFMFSGFNNTRNAYKYDTLTNSYTKLADMPYSFYQGSALAIGNDIYLCGGYESQTKLYKFDTLLNTYEQLNDIPFNFYDGCTVRNGNYIYLFGTAYSSRKNQIYEYDILNKSYRKLSNIPYDFLHGSAIGINNKIYLFGSSSTTNATNTYAYNINTDSYEELLNLPRAFSYGQSAYSNGNIYLYDTSYVYILNMPELENNGIIVDSKQVFMTKLTKKLQIQFSNAQIYDNGELKAYPCYYGDGEKWNLIN